MNKLQWISILLVPSILVVVLAWVGWVWIGGGSGEPSSPITAPTLVLRDTQPTAQSQSSSLEAMQPAILTRSVTATPLVSLRAAPPSPTASPKPSPTASPKPSPTASPKPSPTASSRPAAAESNETTGKKVLFRIVPAESQVRYKIGETLRGSFNLVIGRTNQVAGDVIVDFSSPSNSQLGTIRVNVRTFETDSSQRDRATRSRILQSSQDRYEFATFRPTLLEDLPVEVSVGDEFEFLIVGTLTIRDVAVKTTFQTVLTIESYERLEGSASTSFDRTAFGLTIPSVPFVASVDEEVLLVIEFVAIAVDE